MLPVAGRDAVSGLTSRTRVQGASVVTTVPAEVVRRLGIPAGQELEWIEDGMGGFRVVPRSPELSEALDAHEEIMAEYDSVFRELAK
jgi:bifunctional DNA-binding transcriptional regulator/antitoxin component of YhaV-PrlF toxin-antitoxin module